MCSSEYEKMQIKSSLQRPAGLCSDPICGMGHCSVSWLGCFFGSQQAACGPRIRYFGKMEHKLTLTDQGYLIQIKKRAMDGDSQQIASSVSAKHGYLAVLSQIASLVSTNMQGDITDELAQDAEFQDNMLLVGLDTLTYENKTYAISVLSSGVSLWYNKKSSLISA